MSNNAVVGPLIYNCCFARNHFCRREDGLVSPAPSYGLDWFEGAIASPDRVLQDFIHAVNPSNSTVNSFRCLDNHLPENAPRDLTRPSSDWAPEAVQCIALLHSNGALMIISFSSTL